MEKPNTKSYDLTLKLVIFSCLVVFLPVLSSARPLAMPQNLEADEPALILALPRDDVVVAYPLKKDFQRVLPCDGMDSGSKTTEMGFPAASRLSGKYGPMILNMLPKGSRVPPSGPSKGINNNNN